MTREEAIEVLKHNYPSACFTELCEAVDMAIEALEELTSAEPIKLHVDHDLTEEEIESLKQKIADSPIVFMPSAERKRGEWIFNPSDAIEAMFTKPKCSECGFESADGGNYCPNCGADMRGEE